MYPPFPIPHWSKIIPWVFNNLTLLHLHEWENSRVDFLLMAANPHSKIPATGYSCDKILPDYI